MWQKSAAAILPSSELVISGEFDVDPTRPAIIIANHQVRAGSDGRRGRYRGHWSYLLPLAAYSRSLT
jgi:hypothetical protein